MRASFHTSVFLPNASLSTSCLRAIVRDNQPLAGMWWIMHFEDIYCEIDPKHQSKIILWVSGCHGNQCIVSWTCIRKFGDLKYAILSQLPVTYSTIDTGPWQRNKCTIYVPILGKAQACGRGETADLMCRPVTRHCWPNVELCHAALFVTSLCWSQSATQVAGSHVMNQRQALLCMMYARSVLAYRAIVHQIILVNLSRRTCEIKHTSFDNDDYLCQCDLWKRKSAQQTTLHAL